MFKFKIQSVHNKQKIQEPMICMIYYYVATFFNSFQSHLSKNKLCFCSNACFSHQPLSIFFLSISFLAFGIKCMPEMIFFHFRGVLERKKILNSSFSFSLIEHFTFIEFRLIFIMEQATPPPTAQTNKTI